MSGPIGARIYEREDRPFASTRTREARYAGELWHELNRGELVWVEQLGDWGPREETHRATKRFNLPSAPRHRMGLEAEAAE